MPQEQIPSNPPVNNDPINTLPPIQPEANPITGETTFNAHEFEITY